MFQPIIYALIFIGIVLIVEGLYLVVFGKTLKREKRVNRRLSMLQEGKDAEEVMSILRAEREGSARSNRFPVVGILVEQARHANITLSVPVIALTLAALMLIAFLLFSVFTSAALPIKIIASIATGYGALYMQLRGKAKKRISLFEEQLPDALDLIVRSLRVGHPLNAAIAIVAREMPDPIGTEFGLISDEATYGANIADTLERLAKRVPVHDLRFLAIAVNIQSTSGGNLAEVLDGLAVVIRARFKLFRKVRAITAEARWSGWFLSIFPIVALLLVQLVQPTYYDAVSDHPFFMPGAILTFILLVVNIIFMRILVNIKV